MNIEKIAYLVLTSITFCGVSYVIYLVNRNHFFSSVNFRRRFGILSVPEEVQDYQRKNYPDHVAYFASRTKEQAYRAFILDYLDMETGIHPDINNYASLRGRLMRKAKSLVDRW